MSLFAPAFDHVAWCRSLFAMIVEGGVWAVPRSGLIFTKRAGQLVLTDQMPWSQELAHAWAEGRDVPDSEEALLAYQEEDFEAIVRHFADAGIEVVKEAKL